MQSLEQLYSEAEQARHEQGGLHRAIMLFEIIVQQFPDSQQGKQALIQIDALKHELQQSAFPVVHQQPLSLILVRGVFGLLVEIILPLVLLVLYFNLAAGWKQALLGAALIGMLAWLTQRTIRALYHRAQSIVDDWPVLQIKARIGRLFSLFMATLLVIYFLTALGLLLHSIFYYRDTF